MLSGGASDHQNPHSDQIILVSSAPQAGRMQAVTNPAIPVGDIAEWMLQSGQYSGNKP